MPDDLYIVKLAKITHKSIPIIGFICIGTYILKNADLYLIIYHLKNSEIQYLLIALILGSSQILVATLRFFLFLRAAGSKYKLQDCLKSVTTAIAFNSFLPSKGGDLIKGLILTKNKEEKIRITGITLVERLSDLLTICFLSLIGTTLLWNYKYFSLNIILIFIIIISFLSIKHLFKIPIIGKKLIPLNDIQNAIFINIKYTILSLLTCLIFWSINLVILQLLMKSVGISSLIYEIIIFWPYSIIVGILPLSISGFGTRDSAFLNLINNGELNEAILASTFLYTATVYWFISLVSLVIILFLKFKKR